MTDPRPENSLTRRRFLAGTGALVVVAATGCGSGSSTGPSGPPRRGGTLHVARSEAIDGFKLDAQTANASYQVSQAVIEPLLRFNPNGRAVEPGLAESFSEAADGRSLTLRLAKGARFSDGRPVTPADVAFSVQQWKAGPNYGAVYSVIDSVRTLDDRTVRLELSSPNTSLPAFLTWSIAGIVPRGFGGRSERAFWQKPVGAGPFVVKSWEAAGDVLMVRNPHYFRRGRPYVDTVINSLTADANQRSLQFRSRQVDAVEEILPLQASQYTPDRRIESPLHFTDVLLFNTRRPPFDDVRVRRAVALAIQYDGIVNGLYKGFAEAPTGFLPPNVGLWVPPGRPYFKQDAATARQVLAQTGLAGQAIELVYPSESGFGLVAQVVQRSLQAVGVPVKLVATETGTFLDQTYGGKFQLALWGYNAISPDIADPVAFILSTNDFFTGYSSKGLTAALKAYYAGSREADKRAAVTRIQDEGERAAPFIALDHYRITTAVQANVRGVRPSPWGSYYYDEVWKG